MKGWKSLGEYKEFEANAIKSLLKQHNIPVMLKQADYALPVVFGSGGIAEVLVPESLYEKAIKILDEGGTEDG